MNHENDVNNDVNIDDYCAWLREAGLDAPWSRPGPLIELKKSKVEPYLWRWADIEPRLRATPNFVAPGRGAARRILRLANPGVPERTSAHTLSVAVQYLLPGETAPGHRHTPNALRFMLKGDGAYTIVEGDKCAMAPGDLVLTPSMTWHEHGNEGTEPVMWLDGLDSPVVRYLEILRMEPRESRSAESRNGGLKRTVHYRWTDAYRELMRRADGADHATWEYLDPTTGHSVLPTIGCYLHLIRPGAGTPHRRQTSCGMYHVVRGNGSSTIADITYQWEAGDFFVVPPNASSSHRNNGMEPAVLFSLEDVPLLKAVGLYGEASP
jgi:gentisate 1,2-dioxygenase